MLRSTLEFRMELYPDEERMCRDLYYLDKSRLRILASGLHACRLDHREILVVELVSVAMTFRYLFRAIYAICQRILLEPAVICTEPHGTALDGGTLLVLHEVDNRDRGGRVDFRGYSILETEHVPGKLDNCHLHTETDTEKRHIVLPRIPDRNYLSLKATLTESWRNKDSVHVPEFLLSIVIIEILTVYAVDIDLAFIGGSGMHKRLEYRLVGILKFNIFPDKGDVHTALGMEQFVKELVPLCKIRLRKRLQPEMVEDKLIEFFRLHVQRHRIYGLSIHGLYDMPRLHIAEQGYLAADFRGKPVFRTADYDIRLDSVLLEHLNGMLCRLGLEFLCGTQIRHEGKVYCHAVLLGKFPLELTHGLYERL